MIRRRRPDPPSFTGFRFPPDLVLLAVRGYLRYGLSYLDVGELPGSWTHPDLSRMLYADGKVMTPLFRAHPGDTRLDKTTGELRPLRAELDAGLHFEGTGETAWGTKWVLVAVRSPDVHGRVIVDIDWVAKPGGEAAVAMNSFVALAPHCPGAQGALLR